MEKFEHDDICMIVDTYQKNAHYNGFIGKKVKFAAFVPANPVISWNGYMQCELYAMEDIFLLTRIIQRGQRFLISGVRLRRITH